MEEKLQTDSSASAPLDDVQVKEFERVYKELVNDVFRYAVSCVGRREIAEEITSDTFMTLYRNFAGVDAEWRKQWLFRVAKNQATSYWRRKTVEQKHERDAAPVMTNPQNTDLERTIRESKELKPTHRTCLMLRYFHGMERDEIVKATGLTANQVKSCLQYGLELLRRQLDM